MSDADSTIRRAGPDDAGAIAAIGSRSFTAAYGETASAADLQSHLSDFFGPDVVRRELEQPGRWYLLASIGDQPAGFVKICDSEKHASVPGNRVLELQQVYVLPERQRHGLGQQLINAACNLAGQPRVTYARQPGPPTLINPS